MDITYYQGNKFLTLIEFGPVRFTVWHPLACQDTSTAMQESKSVFYECGSPVEILMNNAPTWLAFADE